MQVDVQNLVGLSEDLFVFQLRIVFNKTEKGFAEFSYAIMMSIQGFVVVLYKQGCRMAYFQTKNYNLGKFWRDLKWKMLVYVMARVFSLLHCRRQVKSQNIFLKRLPVVVGSKPGSSRFHLFSYFSPLYC
jgi:hypothetical protein